MNAADVGAVAKYMNPLLLLLLQHLSPGQNLLVPVYRQLHQKVSPQPV
jgi:hypothetical protein